MLKPSIELTQNQTVSDYSLVVGIAKKAREIASEAETRGEILEEKPVDLAVQEYIQKKFSIIEPSVCEVCGRMDCICEKPPVQPAQTQEPEALEDAAGVQEEGLPETEETKTVDAEDDGEDGSGQ